MLGEKRDSTKDFKYFIDSKILGLIKKNPSKLLNVTFKVDIRNCA